MRAVWIVALCFAMSCETLTTLAFTSADADTLFEAHAKAFYQEKKGGACFMKDHDEQATFEPWLQKNAEAAWQARRTSDNLSWCRWPQPTPEDKRYSWGCSSAVVITQVVRPTETVKPQNSK